MTTTNETMDSVAALVAEGVALKLSLADAQFRAVAIRNAELASRDAFAASSAAADRRGSDHAHFAHDYAATEWNEVAKRWPCAIAAQCVAMHRAAREYYGDVASEARTRAKPVRRTTTRKTK